MKRAAQSLHADLVRLLGRHPASAVRMVFASYVQPVASGLDLESCVRDGVPREVAIGVSQGLAGATGGDS